MNRNALHSVLLVSAAAFSLFGAACADQEPKPWALRAITRDYTFPTRDDDGKVVPEGLTVTAGDLNKGRRMYVHYCYACHGMNGDGRGPASYGLRPLPRDFRTGAYKFDSVSDGVPNDIDLVRIIRGGLHGTAMLKWDLKNDELYHVIQFIKTFPGLPKGTPDGPPCSQYGEATPECTAKLAAYPDSSIEDHIPSPFEVIIEKLKKSEEKLGLQVGQPKPTGEPIVPQHYDENGGVVVDAPADPWVGKEAEAVKKGEALYHFKLQCTTCHAHYLTRTALYDYQIAADPQAVVSYRSEMFYAIPQSNAKALFGVATMPPDFTMNPLRSIRVGSELPDLYRLIASGVGVMPAWAQSAKPDELWALAHYVKSLKDLQLPSNAQKRDALKTMLHADMFVPPAPVKKEEEPVVDGAAGGGEADAKKAESGEADAKKAGDKDAQKPGDKKAGDKKTGDKKTGEKKTGR